MRWVAISLVVANAGGFFWGISPVFGWGKFDIELHGTSCAVAWNDGVTMTFSFTLFTCGLFLPTFLMVFCYVMIARQIRQEGSTITTWADVRMIKVNYKILQALLGNL